MTKQSRCYDNAIGQYQTKPGKINGFKTRYGVYKQKGQQSPEIETPKKNGTISKPATAYARPGTYSTNIATGLTQFEEFIALPERKTIWSERKMILLKGKMHLIEKRI